MFGSPGDGCQAGAKKEEGEGGNRISGSRRRTRPLFRGRTRLPLPPCPSALLFSILQQQCIFLLPVCCLPARSPLVACHLTLLQLFPPMITRRLGCQNKTKKQEDVGYIVSKFPEEKQVVASCTVEPTAAIVESLCALVGVPALKRLDASGQVQESRVRMPTPLPSPCPSHAPPSEAGGGDEGSVKAPAAPAVSQSGGLGRLSREAGRGGVDTGKEARGPSDAAVAAVAAGAAAAADAALKAPQAHGRPAQQAVVAVASAKERLLMETRQALSISTGRLGGVGDQAAGSRASLPSRARAMTGPATAAAAAAATAAPATAAAAAAHDNKRHSYDVRRISRTVSFGSVKSAYAGNGSGRAPPPDYALVSKGVFATATTSTSTTAPSSTSTSTADDSDERRASTGGGGTGGQGQTGTGSSGSGGSMRGGALSRAGAQDDDAASTLDLLSPGAFKGDVAAMVAKLDQHQDNNNNNNTLAERPGRERGGSTSSLSSLPPSVVVVSTSKKQLPGAGPAGAGGNSPRGAEREEVEIRQRRQPGEGAEEGKGHPQQQQEEEEALQATPPLVPRSSSSSSLREEEWHMPPVLLTALEANGVLLPTPLQEAVWKGGRGRARADLIVHVRFVFPYILRLRCGYVVSSGLTGFVS